MSLLSQDIVSRGLEVFVTKSPKEINFDVIPLNITEFVDLFENDLGLYFAISKFDTKILNDGYWESSSEEEKDNLRTKLGGIITDKQGRLFRTDYCPKNRVVRDGLGVTSEVIHGSLLKVDYANFKKITDLYVNSNEQFEFIASADSKDNFEDTTTLATSQRMIYSSSDNQTAKILFSNQEDAEKLLEYCIRRMVKNITSKHVSYLNKKTVEWLLNISDKVGFATHPLRDFADKDRSYELTLHIGKTRWGVHDGLLNNDDKVLLYYDRTSGIWAMVA